MPPRPKPIPAPHPPAADAGDAWPDGELFERESYDDLDLVEPEFRHARGVSLTRVRVQRATLAYVSLEGLDLDDVAWLACDLSNADLTKASARRTSFQDCRFTGLKLAQARFQDTTFVACQGRYPQFEGTVFKRVRFERCSLVEANFDGADLSGVVFAECDLAGATFARANLAGTDFRGSTVESSRLGLDQLRGAVLSPSQAIALLQRDTGVVIEDPC